MNEKRENARKDASNCASEAQNLRSEAAAAHMAGNPKEAERLFRFARRWDEMADAHCRIAAERDEIGTLPPTGGEIFRLLNWSFNIAKFKRLLEGRPERFRLLDIQIIELTITGLVRTDPEYVDRMSETRRDEPVYAVTLDTGILVIDGYHRIARRRKDGFSNVLAWVLPERMLNMVKEPS